MSLGKLESSGPCGYHSGAIFPDTYLFSFGNGVSHSPCTDDLELPTLLPLLTMPG